jgi:hypothetical protein
MSVTDKHKRINVLVNLLINIYLPFNQPKVNNLQIIRKSFSVPVESPAKPPIELQPHPKKIPHL